MNTAAEAARGLVRIPSRYSVAATATRLESILKDRGILVFARINFSADAARVGLSMRPEELVIFGNPRAGTPLMLADPVVGLDLPLKALIWEDENGSTWVAYNEPGYILRRHGLAGTLAANLAAVVPLIEWATRD